jgi:AcrR family transcriptional regulator
MPRPRFLKLAAARRDAILDAASREFAAHGFDDASLNRILDAAGISKGAAYYYFDDKADLFGAVIERFVESVLCEWSLPSLEDVDRDTFWPALEDAQRRAVDLLRTRALDGGGGDAWMLGLARAMWNAPPALRQSEALAPVFRRGMALVVRLLEHGRRLGAVRDDVPLELQMALIFAVDETWDRWVSGHMDGMSPVELVALWGRLMATYRRLLAPDVAGGSQ